MDQASLLVELKALLGGKVDVVTESGLGERLRAQVLREAVPL
jgi:predicted nucleotidyltransferase